MTPNFVKRALRERRTAIGTWFTLGDSMAAEALATVGFDWIVVDMEHTLIAPHQLLSIFQAMGRYPVAPLARVAANTEESINRVLSAGAWGFVVPNVRTREEAEHVVRSGKYPPEGRRGIGGPRAGLSFMTDQFTYFERANEEVLTIIQIEDIDAVSRIDEIMAVPGIDACYVGLFDLCASMGLKVGYEDQDKDLKDAVGVILKAALKHDVAPGIHASGAKQARERVAEGWRLVGVGGDVPFMTSAAREAFSAISAESRKSV